MPRHLLEIDDLSTTELNKVLSLSTQNSQEILLGKGAALLFEKPSNRTRNSMEMAIVQLGGHPVTIRPDEVGIGKRESTGDVAKTLSCYHALIGARVFDHKTVAELSSYSLVPVINMLSDEAHPLQALADLLTIKQEFEQLEGLKIAYIGDSNNVARSLAIGSLMAGVEFRVASPKGYEFSTVNLQRIQSVGGQILQTSEPESAIEGANIIYTDVWTSMGQEKESETRLKDFNGFTVTMEMLALADPESIFLHCLPAHPNEEVTQEVLDSSHSRIWKQAENRMHSARGAIAFLLSNEGFSMKKQRQHLITQLLAENFVSSQEQLISLLKDHEINATQATVSRDLDELGSVMVRVSGGAMVYAIPELPSERHVHENHLKRVLGEWVVEIGVSGNIVMLRTPPGSAHVVASALDRAGLESVLGTVAGDDTVMVVASNTWSGQDLSESLKELSGLEQ